ncbi:MAG: putative DnaC [Candidatus Improbicoccus pseudotrichonymphae]|uniref:DnaC n=1 Tax=Candidatus Improbicoccus pseudotrichonymphae TaxID=3033792 RepID=A0AA48IH09_9FIRM|nr:MAG: putative DnaC [Candidatus Improbicoccus pseudotrichonymphae]
MRKEKSTEVENLGVQNIRNDDKKHEYEQNEYKRDKIIFNCKTCGEPTLKEIFNEELRRYYEVHAFCRCEREAEFKRKFNNLMNNSLLGERYKNVNFENSKKNINTTFDSALERLKKYCENHHKMLENGIGIYIYGNVGTGKTHLTACVANELMKELIPVFFTNLSQISKSIKSTFNKNSSKTEKDLMEKLVAVKFLFFDDLGTEIFTKNQEDNWLQGILFDIVNLRYNLKLPTIFSSNYSLNNLINDRKISERTVDRIVEMTASNVIKITGESFRSMIKPDL